jgi:hypothetical protein
MEFGNNLKPKPVQPQRTMNPMLKKFKAFFDGGPFQGKTLTMDEILKLKELDGYSENMSEFRNKGAVVHRPELDDAPMVKGYLSPQWDDEGLLRYQTQDAYDVMFGGD